MKPFLLLLALFAVALPGFAKVPALLPAEFAGWQKAPNPTVSTDAAATDPVNGAILKEYGFRELESATYARPDRKLLVKLARFNDASGAYGAFTFYKQPQMQTEKFGDQGASANDRVLFYRGNLLVDVKIDRVTAMSAAELRDLAAALPLPPGSARNLPSLPTYLPRQAYVKNSAKYVLGPAALAAVATPIPADLVDFSRSAELVQGNYSSSAGTATLVIISYPTPQIAGERLRAIETWLHSRQSANANDNGSPSINSSAIAKRTGPMVALVAGEISPAEAKSLLASVTYDADVTWNERAGLSRKDNIANLVLAAMMLIGILFLLALAAGVAFGGIRILVKRFFPGRVFDRPQDVEIIQLNLGDWEHSRLSR